MFACHYTSRHVLTISQEVTKHMSYRFDKAGKASQGRGGGGREEVVVGASNEVVDHPLTRTALLYGVLRLGEERIDRNGERGCRRFALIKYGPNKFMEDGFPSGGPSGGARSSCRVGVVEDVLYCPSKRGGEPRSRESRVGVGVEGETVSGPTFTMVKGTLSLLN